MRLNIRELPILSLILASFFPACQKDSDKAQRIIDQALRTHGVDKLEKDSVRFTFRDHRYLHYRDNGRFHYERWPLDTGKDYRDVLANDGFTRYRNGEAVDLKKVDSSAYANALNSVIYFAFLPYRLNDPAVIKEYEGMDSIEGKAYERVRVTFQKEGGGADHKDIFMYWFRKKDARMDFLAYRYFREGGGIRFREAFDRRRINGLLIQNYHNHKAPEGTALKELDELWSKGELEKVSEIRTEKVVWE